MVATRADINNAWADAYAKLRYDSRWKMVTGPTGATIAMIFGPGWGPVSP